MHNLGGPAAQAEEFMQEPFEPKPYSGKTAFEQWAAYEGVPMIRDFIVADLNAIEVEWWERMGAKGCWVVLGAPQDQLSMASYICELAPGVRSSHRSISLRSLFSF